LIALMPSQCGSASDSAAISSTAITVLTVKAAPMRRQARP